MIAQGNFVRYNRVYTVSFPHLVIPYVLLLLLLPLPSALFFVLRWNPLGGVYKNE